MNRSFGGLQRLFGRFQLAHAGIRTPGGPTRILVTTSTPLLMTLLNRYRIISTVHF